MPDATDGGEKQPLTTWLDAVHAILGASGGQRISEAEQAALLDIARIAAHRSERIAAPLTTFLAGVAYGSLSADDRATALQELVARLEV
jgi:hypothetical protein